MPDISKCSNTECPSKESCYRYRVKPSGLWQAYSNFQPDGEKCEAFTSIDGWDERWLIPVGALVKNNFKKE